MKDIQQLIAKDKPNNNWVNIYPLSFVEAIYHGVTKERLDNILIHFNYIAVPFKGTIYKTRVDVRKQFRRKGLVISYFETDGTLHVERYIAIPTDDANWGNDVNWESASNRDIPAGSITTESLSREVLEYLESVVGEKGDKGDTATIQIGGVSALAPESTPFVTNTGTVNDAIFNFGIPRGKDGKSPKVTVGTTTSGESGTDAMVTQAGDTENVILNFVIPRGIPGDKGEKGDYYFLVLNTNVVLRNKEEEFVPDHLEAETRRIDSKGGFTAVPVYYQLEASGNGITYSTVYLSEEPEIYMKSYKISKLDPKRSYRIKAFLDKATTQLLDMQIIWTIRDGEKGDPRSPEQVMEFLRQFLESYPDNIAYINTDGTLQGGGTYAEFLSTLNDNLPTELR